MRHEYEDASGYKGWADSFIAPISEAELLGLLADASSKRIPITIVGGLTGLTGGAAAQGGLAISLQRLNSIEIRRGSAVCGPGVLLKDLQAAAHETGQFFAPDPTEHLASLGGAIATNASGSRSFRYGSTARHVLGLRVAFAGGGIRSFHRGEPVDFAVPRFPSPPPRRTPLAIDSAPAWIGSTSSPARKVR